MKTNRYTLILAAALLALAATGCSAEEKPGPGWGPDPACAVTNAAGEEVEIECAPAAGMVDPVQVLGENVESMLVEADAVQKALDAADSLCARAGAEVCDTEALLNEKLPHLETK